MLLVLDARQCRRRPVAAVMFGAASAAPRRIAGDNLQDLKCGQLVGATPWRQQLML